MRRVALSLIGALLVLTAWTASASAAPPVDVDVNAQPVDGGGVTVTASLDGTTVETMTAGTSVDGRTDNGKPGLCADGLIHTSCTPASEAAPNK
jgi:hypothetical protein